MSVPLILQYLALYYVSSVAVPLNEFFPYGSDVGDTEFPSNDDFVTSFSITYGFKFYNVTYHTLHLSNNGVISFLQPVVHYSPEQFPVSYPVVAPFWADVDTTAAGAVWYRVTTDPEVVQRISRSVEQYFNVEEYFPYEVIVITWDSVGHYHESVEPINTFQCALATDGIRSYVIFLYLDDGINWYTGDASEGVAAQVGVNKGDNIIYQVVDGSYTPDIVAVDTLQGGYYIWDVTDDVVAGNNCGGSMLISPNYGNQLGGTPIVIQGPCFETEDDFKCDFNNIQVTAIVISNERAMCVSPMLDSAGLVTLKLLNGSETIGTADFHARGYYDLADIIVTTHDLLVTEGDVIGLEWHNDSIFHFTDSSEYHIDFFLYEQNNFGHGSNMISITWSNTTLASNIANTGTIDISLPALTMFTGTRNYFTHSPYVVILVKIAVNVSTISPNSTSDYLLALRDSGEAPGRWTHVLFHKHWLTSDDICSGWLKDNVLSNILRPSGQYHCPCNVFQAELPNSGFDQQIYPGRNIVDRFTHDISSVCYYSLGIIVGDDWPSIFRQECCYNNDGNLIVDAPTGGFLNEYHPLQWDSLNPWEAFFLRDISPYLSCCVETVQHCSSFYSQKKFSNCSGFNVEALGWLFGDPHIVTLDGYQYTFNGRGEFVLVEAATFIMQGRMIALKNSTEELSSGTVFSAIVASQNDSDIVEFQASPIGIRTIVNGKWIDYPNGLPVEYNNVKLFQQNDGYAAVFSNGVTISVKQEINFLIGVSFSLPKSFMGMTQGLLGNYNKNPTDDLLPFNTSISLPPDSTLETIHYEFGLSWILEDASDSLFAYNQNDDFLTYYDPTFVPIFVAEINDREYEQELINLCQGDTACIFDIVATGNTEIGLSTLQQTNIISNVTKLAKPIVCEPSCVNGACVATNTCNCPFGYEGTLCDSIIALKCEHTLCLNNGSCYTHIFTDYCTCIPPYTGQYCETVNCGDPPVPYNNATVYETNGTTLGSVVLYSCDEGYKLFGSETIFCQNDGMWSDEAPQCLIDCDIPNLKDNMIVSYIDTVLDSVAVYSCVKGYNIFGDITESICQNNGEWSEIVAECTIAGCNTPSTDISHLIITTNSTSVGAIGVYSCDDGYILQGESTITCQKNGMWSDVATECIVDCGQPPIWHVGLTLEYNSTGLGSVAEYMCIDNGDELVGEPIIFCQSNGSWSGENNSLYCSGTGSRILHIVAGCIGGVSVVIFILIITFTISIFIKMYKFPGKIIGRSSKYELSEI